MVGRVKPSLVLEESCSGRFQRLKKGTQRQASNSFGRKFDTASLSLVKIVEADGLFSYQMFSFPFLILCCLTDGGQASFLPCVVLAPSDLSCPASAPLRQNRVFAQGRILASSQ